MKIKTDTANKALFINGIYESVLKEIQNATKMHPQKSFYLQPYDAAQIVELRINTPSPENPLTLYASISTSLNEIYYEAEIIGWMDKKALFNAENKQKHDSILNDLNTYQPNEGGLFQTAGNSHCANLIVIKNLKKIAKPFPVSLLIKLSDGKSLKNRTRPGKWSAVLKKERVLDEAISYKPIFDKSFEDKIEKSLKESNTKRQQRLLQSNPVPTKSAILSYAFNRNPDVVAEVLIRAKGICELCQLECLI